MIKLIVALLALVYSLASIAADKGNYGSLIVDEVTSIYDADTFRVNVKSWPPIIGERMSIRANGFDAPEIRGKCQEEKEGAQRAKQLTVNALRNAEVIELRNMQRGKYFRIIADVYVDGKSLTDMHIAAGTARPYSGGKREGWCPKG